METGLGVQNLMRSGVSPTAPFSFAETAEGALILANGVDPMLIWNGLSGSVVPAGLAAPATAMELGGSGVGTIVGKLMAYVRFVDVNGRVSDLSPVSNVVDFGHDGFIEDANYNVTTGAVTVLSYAHGLVTGDAILISGSTGLPQLNGSFTITAVDADTFTVNSLAIGNGIYNPGEAAWTLGIQTVLYGAVPVATDPKVVRRQILRNLAGSLDTLYVDVDTADLTTTAFASQATDDVLATGIPVPLVWGDDDLPYASRNGVPPSHKCVVATHKGRVMATCDFVDSAGHVEIGFGSTAVQGVGTSWRTTYAGRLIYVDGALSPYSIASVNEEAQQITLDSPYLESPKPFAAYTIRPEPGERRLVYYSEAALPESWPAYNALAIPESNDEIVGLVSLGQYLYVVERRHIWRLTTQDDPQDGAVFLNATRGSINHRTWVIADNSVFSLDEMGVHVFDGQDSTPISQDVQNVFNDDGSTFFAIDWSQDQTLWHAAHDPIRDCIRWFVSFTQVDGLTNCLCYNYRTKRYWIEGYPTAITASDEATFGARRSLVGTVERRILCLSEGTYDGVNSGTLRGTVTSSDGTTITDSTAAFDAVEAAPVTIVAGTCKGQSRIIATNTATTFTPVDPWDGTPDTTSVYQIGGVPWRWRSGWFRMIDSHDDLARDIELVFKRLVNPCLLDINLYFDHSDTPRSYSRSITQDNVTTTDGSPDVTVDLQAAVGWARARMASHAGTYDYGDTFVSVELSGVQAGEPVRVTQVVLTGLET